MLAAVDAGARVLVADLDGGRGSEAISGLDAERAVAVGADVIEGELRGLIETAERVLKPKWSSEFGSKR